MQATIASPFFAPSRSLGAPAAPTPERRSPVEPIDKAELAGNIVGGLSLGAGLGYLGLEAGLRIGMEYGAGLLGSHPLAQVLSILTFGVQYGVLGAAAGGAVAATVGIAAGAYLGGKVGKAIGGSPD